MTSDANGDDWSMSSCDEYVDGSIYRVKLHNFLTYNDAEFHPGPRLNLILGPNGTGKSSVVCALCVGLGGSTKVLGRADKVGQFVRHEKESGFVEIELFFGSGNSIIRRIIQRDHRSTWFLNGREATYKQILQLMARAKIQIDNLCQFLPQDKVGEFTQMNRMQLLNATEQAVLNGELATTHEEIVRMQQEMHTKKKELLRAKQALDLKKSENQQRKVEAKRIIEHEDRIKETELLEKKSMWVEFHNYKAQVEVLKATKKRCHQMLEDAQQVNVLPLQERLEKEKIRLEGLEKKKKHFEQQRRQEEDRMVRERTASEQLESEQSRILSEIEEIRNHHQETQQKVLRLERELNEWIEEQSQLPPEDLIKRKKVEIENEQRSQEAELFTMEQQSGRIVSQLAKLEDEIVQRRLAIQRFDPDSIRALDWVDQNRSKFKRPVWGPVVLQLTVKELLYAKFVEDTLPKWLMTAIVTECYEDYNTIIHELHSGPTDQRIKASVLIVQDGRCSKINRPYGFDRMRSLQKEYGIIGYLDELITAPDIIQEVLRVHGGVHTVLVGSLMTEDAINRGVDIFSKLSSREKKVAFVTPKKKYVVSVSRYGNGNVTTRTNDLQNPRLLAASSSNSEKKDELSANLKHLQNEVKTVQNKILELKEKEKSAAEARSASLQHIAKLRTQLVNIMRMEERIVEAKRRVDCLRRDLDQDLSVKKKDALSRLRKLLVEYAFQLGNIIFAYADTYFECNYRQGSQLEKGLTSTKKAYRAAVEYTSANFCCNAQQLRVNGVTQCLRQAVLKICDLRQKYEDSKEQLLCAANEAVQLKKRAERQAPWETYESQFEQSPDDLEELRGLIESNKASLECFRGDTRILSIYRRVKEEIINEEHEVEELQAITQTEGDEINQIRESWHAQLRAVVEEIDRNFQEYFKDIGCMGEVVLIDDDEDLTKWGIERRAQFRKNASLSIMTSEEQSGGEKSVGTIMYLMAIQNMTCCPFRVVDEINQGMDVYNERKVFHRITKASCGKKLPQYFLITPKLITKLEYHRDTKVMVILNGPFNKLSQEQWNPSKYIESERRNKRLSVAQDDENPKKRC
uniref:Structural maintenance of chromosomes protein 5 n=1 Tax=Albugo laibachii Nc14 TaxID=890382 RepID=F0WTB7_9STRA|nr:structural maintenance of chromosomes protein 5 puta [Albugo laibachii Nc14]|eukprot:CCA24606.1 structural maintenance of chromosomes protein 5 puta [Albugo laibachii Nc14]